MKSISLVCAFLILGACASVGNMALKDENEKTVAAKIVEGKTTRQQIQVIYGGPNYTTITDGGNLIWTYRYIYKTPKVADFIPIVHIFAGGENILVKELVIMFDKNDVVTKFSMQESLQEVSLGVAPK